MFARKKPIYNVRNMHIDLNLVGIMNHFYFMKIQIKLHISFLQRFNHKIFKKKKCLIIKVE